MILFTALIRCFLITSTMLWYATSCLGVRSYLSHALFQIYLYLNSLRNNFFKKYRQVLQKNSIEPFFIKNLKLIFNDSVIEKILYECICESFQNFSHSFPNLKYSWLSTCYFIGSPCCRQNCSLFKQCIIVSDYI